MSIILKGIDMPKQGEAIVFNGDGTAITDDEKIIDVIQIPKDHGRLIDADELKAKYIDDDDVYTPWLRKDIDDAPTILESEE